MNKYTIPTEILDKAIKRKMLGERIGDIANILDIDKEELVINLLWYQDSKDTDKRKKRNKCLKSKENTHLLES